MKQNKNDILKNLDILSLEDLEKNIEINNENTKKINFSETNENNNFINSNEDIEFYDQPIKENNQITHEHQTNEKTDVENKKTNKIFNWAINIFKYIWTSGLIFVVLLLTANYSAYINLAQSYFFEEKFQEKWNSLSKSVSSSQIIIKEKNKKEKRIEEDKKNQKSVKSKYSIKKLVNEVNKEKPSLNIDISPYENRVVIPKIWKNVPIINIKQKVISKSNELENIFMKELEDWVVRYPWSSEPGKKWNTFIFWHSSNYPWIKWDYNQVFALLGKVNIWDKIISYYNQKKYIYKIKEKKVIKPWDVSILKNNKNNSELTLMTCWPVWTTLNRLIVTWELVKE